MKNEGDFQIAMMAMLKPHGHCSNIETGRTAAGVFDLNFADELTTCDYWIELKFWGGRREPDIKQSQVKWGARRWAISRNVFMLTATMLETDGYMLLVHTAPHMIRLRAKPSDRRFWRDCAILEYHQKTTRVEKEFIDKLLQRMRNVRIQATG